MSESTSAPRERRVGVPLVYPLAAPAADGSVVEIAPGVLWARMPMPMALDHINVYLLRGEHGWTVVDTGLNADTSREMWERIVAEHLDGLPIEALVCTHWHYDHAGLARWFGERFGVPLYMTLGEYYTLCAHAQPLPDPLPSALLNFYLRAGLTAERVRSLFDSVRGDPFLAPAPPSFRRLRDGDELAIGSRRWRVVVGEGHAPEHACLYDAEDRLLLAGDQLLPRISSNVLVSDVEPEADPLSLWLASLSRLEQLAPDTLVLPSHQEVFRGLHLRTRELSEHHHHQLNALRGHLRELGRATAFEAMQKLFPRRRGAIDDILALGETMAHLSWLQHAGEVLRQLDTDGVYRFELAVDDAGVGQPPEISHE